MWRSVLVASSCLVFMASISTALAKDKPSPPGEPAAQEYVVFIDDLAQTMNAREPSFFDFHLNAKEIINRALTGLPTDQAFADGMLSGFTKEGSVPRAMAVLLGDKGTFLPLWVRTIKGKTRAMMRVVTTDGAINYHELLLNKNAKSRIEVVDVYVYASGELVSQTMRRGALSAMAVQNKSLIERLVEGEQEFAKYFETIVAIPQAHRAGKSQEALDLIAKLPAKLQTEKSICLIRIQAAMQVSEEEYVAALDDFAKNFPNDPAGDLLQIDASFLHKDFDKCLATLDRLDKRVGGDPFLDSFRANIALVNGKYNAAKKYFAAAVAGAPKVPQPYFALLEIALSEKQFAEAVRLFTKLERDLAIRFPDDLSQTPAFADFAKSPEYAAWQAKRRKP